MKTKFAILTLIFLFISNGHATTITFSGNLDFIETNSGSSAYSGLSIGDVFSGSLTFGDNASDASGVDNSVLPTGIGYIFTGAPYGGFITGGSIVTIGVNSESGIGDNDEMGDDAVEIGNLYGSGATTAATIADTWGVDSSNRTQNFGLTLYSLNTSLYSGLDFQPIPPLLGDSDFSLFYIAEKDTFGNTIYLAYGKLTAISAIPEPNTMFLISTGIIVLTIFGQRRA